MTTFYLATKPAPAAVVQWSFNFANIYSSVTTATNAFLHVQDFARNATIIDRNIGFGIYLDAGGLVITGTYFGSLEIFNTQVNDILRASLNLNHQGLFAQSIAPD